jgi:hypothetical protein
MILNEEIEDVFRVANSSPNYILANSQMYKAIEAEIEHHQKWNIDLFSPKGLAMLFKSCQ